MHLPKHSWATLINIFHFFFLHALIIFQLKFKSMRYLNEGLSILIIIFQLRSIINRTKFIYKISYNFIQYLFIKGEFWQIHHWITFSFYKLYVYKIYWKLKINSYIINKLFIASFCSLKLCIKYKFIYQIVDNIQLTQNLICILRK